MGVHLECGVIVQELSPADNHVRRTFKYDKARVSLVRSERFEYFIRVKSVNGKSKSLGYKLLKPKFFTKFLREGKSTIALGGSFANIMLSDCPPDILLLFLRNVKSRLGQSKNKVPQSKDRFKRTTPLSLLEEVSHLESPRTNIFSGKSRSFTCINLSPILVSCFTSLVFVF